MPNDEPGIYFKPSVSSIGSQRLGIHWKISGWILSRASEAAAAVIFIVEHVYSFKNSHSLWARRASYCSIFQNFDAQVRIRSDPVAEDEASYGHLSAPTPNIDIKHKTSFYNLQSKDSAHYAYSQKQRLISSWINASDALLWRVRGNLLAAPQVKRKKPYHARLYYDQHSPERTTCMEIKNWTETDTTQVTDVQTVPAVGLNSDAALAARLFLAAASSAKSALQRAIGASVVYASEATDLSRGRTDSTAEKE